MSAMTSAAPGVVLISEHRILLELLCRHLEGGSHAHVIGIARSASDATHFVHDPRATVAVLGLDIPNGIVAAHEITRTNPAIRILAIGVAENERDVIAWAEAGATGCVGSDEPVETLVDAIRSVAAGDTSCSSRLAAPLFRRVARLALHRPLVAGETAESQLTKREAEIAALMSHGLSNKQIARSLQLSELTVKNHVHHILRKLGLHRRNELVGMLFDRDAAA